MVFVDGVLALDADEVLALCGKFTVEFRSCHRQFLVFLEAAGSLAHYREYLWKMLVQLFFEDVENFRFQVVDFFPKRLALVVVERLYFSFQVADFFFLVGFARFQFFFYLCHACAQFVVRQRCKRGVDCVYFIDYRLYFL